MNLNRIKDVQKIKLDKFLFSNSEHNNVKPQEIAAFDIDNMIPDGRLALLYIDTFTKPKIWFQDLSCCWFFIANSFTDYFRLMFMHLGIPHWHYVFTNVGMDPISLQWCRYFCPERLTLDINSRNDKPQKEVSPKKKKKRIKGVGLHKRRPKSKKGEGAKNFEKFSSASKHRKEMSNDKAAHKI